MTYSEPFSSSAEDRGNCRSQRWRRIRLAFFCLANVGVVAGSIDYDDQSYYDDYVTPTSSQADSEDESSSSSFFDSISNLLDGTITGGVDDGEDDDEAEVERGLSSDSRDSKDDYWRWPDDYFDEETKPSRDDDFYKYIGDEPPPRLFPLKRRSVIGFMIASMGITLGASGGVGGGGIVVPIYIIALGLKPRFSIPLGSVTVVGGAIAGLILNMRRRHPLADRPIIDWDLILVMEPLVLVGALFGSLLHRVTSEKIVTALLVLLLSVLAQFTLAKAKRMYEAEAKYIEHLKAARWDYLGRVDSMRSAFRVFQEGAEPESKTCSPLAPSSPHRTMSIDSRSTVRHMDADEKQRILILNPDFVTLRTDLLEQEKLTPRSKILALVGKFTVLMFLNVTLGGGTFKSPWGIQCGSVAYWVVHIIMVAFLVASAWAAQTYIVNRHEIKEIVRFDYVHGDIRWEKRNAMIYPIFFMISGMCAGLFGIGGGLITVPLMLNMGVHPSVVTATASTMVFFSGALSASSFAVFNLVLWDYAIVCMVLGFMATFFGQVIMWRARQTSTEGRNFERNSFIAYCIGSVILLSALLMTVQYVLHIVTYDEEQEKKGDSAGFCEGYRVSY